MFTHRICLKLRLTAAFVAVCFFATSLPIERAFALAPPLASSSSKDTARKHKKPESKKWDTEHAMPRLDDIKLTPAQIADLAKQGIQLPSTTTKNFVNGLSPQDFTEGIPVHVHYMLNAILDWYRVKGLFKEISALFDEKRADFNKIDIVLKQENIDPATLEKIKISLITLKALCDFSYASNMDQAAIWVGIIIEFSNKVFQGRGVSRLAEDYFVKSFDTTGRLKNKVLAQIKKDVSPRIPRNPKGPKFYSFLPIIFIPIALILTYFIDPHFLNNLVSYFSSFDLHAPAGVSLAAAGFGFARPYDDKRPSDLFKDRQIELYENTPVYIDSLSFADARAVLKFIEGYSTKRDTNLTGLWIDEDIPIELLKIFISEKAFECLVCRLTNEQTFDITGFSKLGKEIINNARLALSSDYEQRKIAHDRAVQLRDENPIFYRAYLAIVRSVEGPTAAIRSIWHTIVSDISTNFTIIRGNFYSIERSLRNVSDELMIRAAAVPDELERNIVLLQDLYRRTSAIDQALLALHKMVFKKRVESLEDILEPHQWIDELEKLRMGIVDLKQEYSDMYNELSHWFSESTLESSQYQTAKKYFYELSPPISQQIEIVLFTLNNQIDFAKGTLRIEPKTVRDILTSLKNYTDKWYGDVVKIRFQLKTFGMSVDLYLSDIDLVNFKISPNAVEHLESMGISEDAVDKEKFLEILKLEILANQHSMVGSLWNMITNSKKHSAKNVVLDIGMETKRDYMTGQSAEYCKIALIDDGEGIKNPDLLKKEGAIIDRYAIFDLNTTSGTEGGTGLGLNEVWQAIYYHNGRVNIETSADNDNHYTRIITDWPVYKRPVLGQGIPIAAIAPWFLFVSDNFAGIVLALTAAMLLTLVFGRDIYNWIAKALKKYLPIIVNAIKERLEPVPDEKTDIAPKQDRPIEDIENMEKRIKVSIAERMYPDALEEALQFVKIKSLKSSRNTIQKILTLFFKNEVPEYEISADAKKITQRKSILLHDMQKMLDSQQHERIRKFIDVFDGNFETILEAIDTDSLEAAVNGLCDLYGALSKKVYSDIDRMPQFKEVVNGILTRYMIKKLPLDDKMAKAQARLIFIFDNQDLPDVAIFLKLRSIFRRFLSYIGKDNGPLTALALDNASSALEDLIIDLDDEREYPLENILKADDAPQIKAAINYFLDLAVSYKHMMQINSAASEWPPSAQRFANALIRICSYRTEFTDYLKTLLKSEGNSVKYEIINMALARIGETKPKGTAKMSSFAAAGILTIKASWLIAPAVIAALGIIAYLLWPKIRNWFNAKMMKKTGEKIVEPEPEPAREIPAPDKAEQFKDFVAKGSYEEAIVIAKDVINEYRFREITDEFCDLVHQLIGRGGYVEALGLIINIMADNKHSIARVLFSGLITNYINTGYKANPESAGAMIRILLNNIYIIKISLDARSLNEFANKLCQLQDYERTRISRITRPDIIGALIKIVPPTSEFIQEALWFRFTQKNRNVFLNETNLRSLFRNILPNIPEGEAVLKADIFTRSTTYLEDMLLNFKDEKRLLPLIADANQQELLEAIDFILNYAFSLKAISKISGEDLLGQMDTQYEDSLSRIVLNRPDCLGYLVNKLINEKSPVKFIIAAKALLRAVSSDKLASNAHFVADAICRAYQNYKLLGNSDMSGACIDILRALNAVDPQVEKLINEKYFTQPEIIEALAQGQTLSKGITKIYIGDPDPITQTLMAKILGRLGYELIQYDYLNSIGKAKPQLAILNPFNADKLAAHIRKECPGIRILVLSAGIYDESDIKAKNWDYFMQKPFGVVEFISLVKKISDEIAVSGPIDSPMPVIDKSFEYEPLPIEPDSDLAKLMGQRIYEYTNRLVKDSRGRLFLIKKKIEITGAERKNYIWRDKNNPVREYVSFMLARAINANVCDIVIPPLGQRQVLAQYVGAKPDEIYLVRVSYNYKLEDSEVRQKDFKKAFTRNLVAMIFMRKWDFHKSNHAPLADAQIPMIFDNDQALAREFKNIDDFFGAFISNYFSYSRGMVLAGDILDKIDFDELTVAVTESKALDLKALSRDMGMSLPVAYISDKNLFIGYLQERQESLASDVSKFLSDMISNDSSTFRKENQDPERDAALERYSALIESSLMPAIAIESGRVLPEANLVDDPQEVLENI